MNKKELVCAGVGFLLLVVLVFMAIKFSDNSGTDLGNGSSDEYMEDIESGENTITTETYTINDTVNGARVSFEFAANYLGFKTQEETSGVGFVNPKNGANISVLLEYIDANEILNATMDSFNTDIYHDFEKIEIAGYSGYKVLYSYDDTTSVEVALVLNMNEDGMANVTNIRISDDRAVASGAFDSVKFYNTDEFQHLLNTLKIEETTE